MKPNQLLPGDCLCYSNSSLLARIIQRETNSKFNHCAIVYRVGEQITVAESLADGFREHELSWSIRKAKRVIVKRPNFRVNGIDLTIKQQIELARPYDFAGLIHQLVYQSTGKWIGKGEHKADRRLYCSEAVALIYYKLTGNFNFWYKTDPEDLANEYSLFQTFELEK